MRHKLSHASQLLPYFRNMMQLLPKTYCFIVCLSLYCSLPLTAQTQMDSLDLDSIVVKAQKQGIHIVTEDEIVALSMQEPLILHYTGRGRLTSLHFGGLPSELNAVLWNGQMYRSPLSGVTDLSQLPSYLFDEVRPYQHAIQPLALELKNASRDKSNIMLTQGSFGLWEAGAKINLVREKINLYAKAYYQRAKNNFPFDDLFDVRRRQTHAAQNQLHAIFGVDAKLGKNNSTKHDLWIGQNKLDIPPNISTDLSQANQKSNDIRGVHQFLHEKKHNNWGVSFDWNYNTLRYSDALFQIDAQHDYYQLHPKLFWKNKQVKQWDLEIASGLYYDHATSTNIQMDEARSTWHVDARASGQHKKWSYGATTQLIYWDKKFRATYVAYVNYAWNEMFQSTFESKSFFRQATFNELYWEPGGNASLVGEQGWSLNLGLITKLHPAWNITLEGNYAKLPKGIRWLPNSNGIYQAVNVLDQKNILANLKIEQRTVGQNINWTNTLTYQFTSSIYQLSPTAQSQEAAYTPKHKLFWLSSMRWKNILLQNQWYYQSKMYGNTQDILADYFLWDVQVAYLISNLQGDVRIELSLRNITNSSYQMHIAYPMPGINYALRISYEF